MQSATETFTVRRELTIAARPETVWRLLVEPGEQSRWWGSPLDFEARPGGPFRVEVLPGHIASGEFVEVEAPRRLVYTFGWEDEGNPVPAGSSRIEIELAEEDGGTRLRFLHSGLPTEEERAQHGHGWDHYLSRLATAARGEDPGRDPFLDNA
jgi:uncharacterized protein YndB with AHSA1/START domain